MKADLESFLSKISTFESTDICYNMYNGNRSYNFEIPNAAEMRRNNLKTYFENITKYQPNLLFVGEAPGYLGCMYSGIPFTSEHIMLDHPFKLPFFGSGLGYHKTSDGPKTQKETTATIFWKQMSLRRIYPVVWNIFPFHPHKPQKPLSNRAPTPDERAIGLPILKEIVDIFEIGSIIAVGRSAEKGVSKLDMDLPISSIRHPSYGGEKEFIKGLDRS